MDITTANPPTNVDSDARATPWGALTVAAAAVSAAAAGAATVVQPAYGNTGVALLVAGTIATGLWVSRVIDHCSHGGQSMTEHTPPRLSQPSAAAKASSMSGRNFSANEVASPEFDSVISNMP